MPIVFRKSIPIALPLICYLAIAIPVGIFTLERFNSDGVCYLHRAMLLADGDVRDAISAYWSPGLIVSTVLLLKTGMDSLHAIHWTLLVWGGVYVVAATIFFGKDRVGIIAACVVALVAVRLSAPTITPDVLVGAAMLMYLTLASKRKWFWAGLVAGGGFFCKAYFLPFFLLQFSLTVLWYRAGWRGLVQGLLGFALVGGPWIGMLSAHEGHFVFSSAARRNRFMQDVAPADVRAHPPDVSSLPPDPFISNMEVTDRDAWPAWSPFDSRAHFFHQCHIAIEHLGEIIADVWRFDHVAFALLGVVMAMAVGDRETRWLVISGAIYASGFLLVVYESRYTVPVLLPIALLVCIRVAKQLPRRWQWRPLVPMILLAFAASAVAAEYDVITQKESNVTYREIAAKLRSAGLDDRFATNTANRDKAACTAFFLDQKFIALPNDLDPVALQSKLDERGVVLLFDWFDPLYVRSNLWPQPQLRSLIDDKNWTKQMSIRLDSKRRLDVYKRSPIGGTSKLISPVNE